MSRVERLKMGFRQAQLRRLAPEQSKTMLSRLELCHQPALGRGPTSAVTPLNTLPVRNCRRQSLKVYAGDKKDAKKQIKQTQEVGGRAGCFGLRTSCSTSSPVDLIEFAPGRKAIFPGAGCSERCDSN